MIRKKTILIIGALGSTWWLTLYLVDSTFFSVTGQCHMNYVGWCGTLSGFIEHTVVFTMPLIILFLFSLITYRMRTEIYETWFRFARWWIPLSMLAIFLAPEYSHDWLYPITKGYIAFATSAIFLVISALIVVIKFVSLRK